MKRIAVINQKGGVGKTTTTANLGAVLARSGARVLLVDLDPQGHLSLHFGIELGDEDRSIYDVLTSGTPIQEVVKKGDTNITVLPSDIDLAGAEAELVSVTGREVLLREALALVQDDYDYLLIDCPPSLGVLTINALVAATEVLIPLQAHFFALQGLGKLLDTVSLVRQRINPALKVMGVALCMHEASTKLAGEVVEDLTRFLEAGRGTDSPWADAIIFKSRIRRNIKLAEAASFGQTVFDYAPTCNGVIDYTRMGQEIFNLTDAQIALVKPEPVAPTPPPARVSPKASIAANAATPLKSDDAPVVVRKRKAETVMVPQSAGTNHSTTDQPVVSVVPPADSKKSDTAATTSQPSNLKGNPNPVAASA